MHVVPDPTNVMVTPPHPTIFAGSSLTLTCTVTLPPAVDVSVIVRTVWTGHRTSNPVPATTTGHNSYLYTSTTILDAARSGSYTCQAMITSSSYFITGSGMMSGTATVTVGESATGNKLSMRFKISNRKLFNIVEICTL